MGLNRRVEDTVGRGILRQDVGHPAIRYGVIFGLLLGLIGVGVTVLEWLSGSYTPHVSIVGSSISLGYSGKDVPLGWDCTNAAVTFALIYASGVLASRRTGKIRSGAGAGLIAGSLGAIMAGVATLNMILVSSPASLPSAHASAPVQANATLLVAVSSLLTVLGACIFGGLYGAFFGFLGGSLGVARLRPPQQRGMPPDVAPYGSPNALYSLDAPTRRTDRPTA